MRLNLVRVLGWLVIAHGVSHGTFALLPTSEGRTRFIIRSTMSHRAIPVWASALNFMAFEVPHFIMERRMMLTIKALAERHGGLEASTQTGR